MCGIFGITYHNSDTIPDEDRLKETAKLLHHRGPDHTGIYSESNIGLVHTRLSLLDLSNRSNQPFWDIDKRYVIVYNGEIYNFKELRSELEHEGIKFRTTSDTEVLLAWIINRGINDTLSKLEGMFTFALYDKIERTLILARDRFGIKPLFIYDERDAFVFASEVMAMRPWIKFEPDLLSISSYLSGFAGPTKGYTFYKKIKILPPGTILTIQTGKPAQYSRFFKITNFWDQDLADNLNRRKQSKIIDKMDELLFESVRKQLVADAPVGALCSGGLDSSLIMAMASKLHNNLAIFHANVEGPQSEYQAAKKLAKYLKLDLKTAVTKDEDTLNQFPEVIEHYGHPFSIIPSSIPFMEVSKLVRENSVKAVLTGEGSDECYLGYPFLIPDISEWKRNPRRELRRLIKKLLKHLKILKNINIKKREFIMGFSPYSSLARASGPISHSLAELNLHLYNRFEVALETEDICACVNNGNGVKTQKNYAKSLDLLNYNLRALLHRNDAMGMAASIESRFPFLDTELVKMAVNLPYKYKIRFFLSGFDERHYLFKDKWVLRKVAERYLPDEISHRPKEFFRVDAFNRMQINPVFFQKSFVADLLGLSSPEIHYLMDHASQNLKVQLLHLEAWGHVCLNNLSKQSVRSKIRKYISLKPHP